MNQSMMTQPGPMHRHLNHVRWLVEEWPWHAFLAGAVFLALTTLVS